MLDTVAVNLKNGKDATGHISLRSAIQAANARPSADTILLPPGVFKLTITGANENDSLTGDIDIRRNLKIVGKGATKTVIDGAEIDRVFQVSGGRIVISGVTIEHGSANDGGGVLVSGGEVTLTSVVIANNMAVGAPGTAGASGGNGSAGFLGGAAFGGGISNQGGSLTISKSTIVANQAVGGGGGNGGNGGFAQGADGTGSGNGGPAVGGKGGDGGPGGAGIGGGIYNGIGGRLAINATTITRNTAKGGNGGFGGGWRRCVRR